VDPLIARATYSLLDTREGCIPLEFKDGVARYKADPEPTDHEITLRSPGDDPMTRYGRRDDCLRRFHTLKGGGPRG
jgi:hypothetical protein